MTTRPTWAPDDVDPSRPSVARVYDYYLGGSHNFASDREFGKQALERMPHLPSVLRDNRDFLRRAVLHLSALGVEQFLDLGSGIPTVGNVHEVARAANPRSTVVYVDHDPVAVAHGTALLRDDPLSATVRGDLRDPAAVLAAAVATGLLDLERPVAVLFIAVLHFVHDEDRPADLVGAYARAAGPGSYVAISHARLDGQAELREAAKVYDQQRSPGAMRLRSRDEVQELFGATRLLDPGLVLVPRWRPEPGEDGDGAPDVPEDYPGFAGVGRTG